MSATTSFGGNATASGAAETGVARKAWDAPVARLLEIDETETGIQNGPEILILLS